MLLGGAVRRICLKRLKSREAPVCFTVEQVSAIIPGGGGVLCGPGSSKTRTLEVWAEPRRRDGLLEFKETLN